MKSILLFVFLIGIFMVLFGYSKNFQKCPEPQIEYRYIPRSFYEEQMSPPEIFKSFNGMFNDKDTWFSYPTNVDSS
jgi:hypothetical protein